MAARDGDGPGTATTTPFAITSDAPRFTTVDQLAAASDLVIRGIVVADERGRTFGDPGRALVESRVVSIEVLEVLRGERPAGAAVRLEEAGWLEDGTPVAVDGLASLPEGSEAVWFLQAVPSTDAPTWIVTGPQGRYVVRGEELAGVDGDPLVDAVEQGGLVALRAL